MLHGLKRYSIAAPQFVRPARNRLKLSVKSLLFPGLDLNTRCRYRFLSRWIRSGQLDTLDAGFGNGALAYAAYCKGNRVVGVNIHEPEVRRTSDFFAQKGIPRSRLEFRTMNLYDVRSLNQSFDQIICSETLEHITRDAEVVQAFADMLRPGGCLILCCPYARHPDNALGRTNEPETGGHVRDGYTLESYEALLRPVGLSVTDVMGLGSPLLRWLGKCVRSVRNRFGDAAALPLFLAVLPLTRLDRPNPPVPFSIAVVATKSGTPSHFSGR